MGVSRYIGECTDGWGHMDLGDVLGAYRCQGCTGGIQIYWEMYRHIGGVQMYGECTDVLGLTNIWGNGEMYWRHTDL